MAPAQLARRRRKEKMNPENEPSQQECKALVDELWRSMLSFAAQGSPTLGEECIRRFEERELAKANKMPRDQGQRYIDMIQDERGRIFDEYTSNADALKRRLNVAGYSTRNSSVPRFANVVVATAVRATIWETVRAIFRR